MSGLFLLGDKSTRCTLFSLSIQLVFLRLSVSRNSLSLSRLLLILFFFSLWLYLDWRRAHQCTYSILMSRISSLSLVFSFFFVFFLYLQIKTRRQ